MLRAGGGEELRPSDTWADTWQLRAEPLHVETALPPTPGTEFLLEGHRNLQGTLTAWKSADGTQTQPPRALQAQQCSAVHKAWPGTAGPGQC